MDVIRKDATITNTTEDFPGSFEVILSAPTKDRDGDTLLPDEWKMPLPDHITFDSDHGMTVATTVGSGVPSLNDAGELVVSGTYSSLPRAQEVRTLVNEGHIRTTSVAFMSEKTEKDGKSVAQRELLNGAFVAIPSNREALVLASKGVKAGARNSASDLAAIQEIHDASMALGADCPGAKSVGVATVKVDMDFLIEQVEKGVITRDDVLAIWTKDADTEAASDPGQLAQAVDAAVDEAINLFATGDASTLPAEVQQAIALIQAADATVDELLDALGVPDPDEDESADPAASSAAAPAKAAAPAETTAADDESLQTRVHAMSLIASSYTD
jgi:hypothetical protein